MQRSWSGSTRLSDKAAPLDQKMMAALAWVRPKFRKGREVSLPHSRVGALALVRRSPGHTRLPLPELVVYAMVTFEQFRGRGVAPALMSHAMQHSGDGSNRFCIDCRIWNKSSLRAIEKAGFQRVATMDPLPEDILKL